MWTWIMAHQTTSALIAFWLASNIATSLPSPTQTSNGFYKFTFTLAHSLTGSVARVFPNLRLPNDPTAGTPTFFTKP